MIKINGKYNQAFVYTNTLEESAHDQLVQLCGMQAFKDSKIRIMPDVHAGKGCTIGTTMTITDKVVPNMVGVDIGCGMEVTKFKEKDIDLELLDDLIYVKIPAGTNIRKIKHAYSNKIDLSKLRCFDKIKKENALLSIGSLGGGNHFIEMDRDEDGYLYLVIHSGSRHLGKEVAELYQKLAIQQLHLNDSESIDHVIERLKSEGREKEIENTIVEMKKQNKDIPTDDMAYLSGKLFDDYINDMKITQQFAILNRQAMSDEIIKGMGLHKDESFTTIHNYIDTENMILRKGSVSAKKDEKIIIPMNMRDGSLICIGKGNPEWNYSAPHGAGRLYSRSQAVKNITLDEFKKSMEGIYTTSVNEDTIDESPMAYKPMDEIIRNIQDSASVYKIIKPVYNFKSAEKVTFGRKNR